MRAVVGGWFWSKDVEGFEEIGTLEAPCARAKEGGVIELRLCPAFNMLMSSSISRWLARAAALAAALLLSRNGHLVMSWHRVR